MFGGAVVTASPAIGGECRLGARRALPAGRRRRPVLVVPHADPVYYRARPRSPSPPTACWSRTACSACTRRWLPAAAVDGRQVAAVHAAGLPVANRSHFAAMEEVEDADPGSRARVGWLNRLVGTTPGDAPLQGFAPARSVIPTSLYGPEPAMSADGVETSPSPGADPRAGGGLACASCGRGNRTTLGRSMAATLDRDRHVRTVEATDDNSELYPARPGPRPVHGRADHPRRRGRRGDHRRPGRLGHALRCRGPDGGWMYGNNEDFADAIAAFLGDLGTQAPQGHAGHAQRVRPAGPGERQLRHRPRLRQRHVRRRRGRPGWLPRPLAGPRQQLRLRPHGDDRLPPGARRHRAGPVRRASIPRSSPGSNGSRRAACSGSDPAWVTDGPRVAP